MPNQLMCSVKTTSQAVYLPLGRKNDVKIAWILQFTTASPGTIRTDLGNCCSSVLQLFLFPKLIICVNTVGLKAWALRSSEYLRQDSGPLTY